MRDYYKVLGVSHDATLAEIKAAYRKLCRQWHPDYNPGSDIAQEMLKMINQAYEALCHEFESRHHKAFVSAGPLRTSYDGVSHLSLNCELIRSWFQEKENRHRIYSLLLGMISSFIALLRFHSTEAGFTATVALIGVILVWFSDVIGNVTPGNYRGLTGVPSTPPVVSFVGWVTLLLSILWKPLYDVIQKQ